MLPRIADITSSLRKANSPCHIRPIAKPMKAAVLFVHCFASRIAAVFASIASMIASASANPGSNV